MVSCPICPVRSATGRKRSGVRRPSDGCCQRTSASAPVARPVARSIFGWKNTRSSSRSIPSRSCSREHQALAAAQVAGGVVDEHGEALVLGLLRGDLGALQQLGDALPVRREEDEPHAHLHGEGHAVDLQRRLDPRDEPLQGAARIPLAAVGPQDHGKRVAGQAHRNVGAGVARQARGELAEHLIADPVAEGLVDLVQVDRGPAPPGRRACCGDPRTAVRARAPLPARSGRGGR